MGNKHSRMIRCVRIGLGLYRTCTMSWRACENQNVLGTA